MRNRVERLKIRPLAAARKLSRGLFDQLAEEIKSGRLGPGERLPTEQELTRAAGVSRTVVREAVAALRAEGLVVTRQGVGAFVSAEPQRAPFRIEPERMQSLGDILNVMELRLGVEIESAGLAAERAGKAQVRAIGAALEAIERASAQGRTAVDEDLAFHRAVAEATGNPEFARFLQFIGRHLIPRRTVSGLPERMGGRRAYLALIQEEHRRIYEAIRAADAKAARDAMRRHLTRSLDRYRKLAAEQQKAA
ncbi:MAG TPA: FadR/GntR family transcriptional regulator [Burkholderiales bacterium]|nr:FadR/GntR family transcriptional regulator [Burkholderiales bacterium]